MKAQDIRTFIRAGRATFTLQSVETGKHFTFRVVRSSPRAPGVSSQINYFVSVLVGPDEWAYMGVAAFAECALRGSKSSKVARADTRWKAFEWFLRKLARTSDGALLRGVIFRHEGKCGRCARELTHPESIDLGIGPECAAKLGIVREPARGPSLQQMLAERRAEYAGDSEPEGNWVDNSPA